MKQLIQHLLTLRWLSLFCLAVTAAGLLSSCDDHDEVCDSTMKVGNIYLSDHSVISPAGYDPARHTAAGVIFYVHGDTALVVSLRESGSYVYSDSLGVIPDVVNDAVSRCGQQNTAAIRVSAFNTHFPALGALDTTASPVTGWSLPSAGDLRALSAVLPAVSRTMTAIGGDAFSRELYFTTSQDGTTSSSEQENYYTVSLATGNVISSFKGEPSRLRLVLTITR